MKIQIQNFSFQQKIILFGLSFILLNSIFIVSELFWGLSIPIALLIIYLAFFKLDILFMIIVFASPLSINIENIGGGLGLSIPTDPIFLGITLMFIFRFWLDFKYDIKIFKHPITITLLIHITWLFITTINSELPLISIKFFISKIWHIIPFYFLAIQIFKYPHKIKLYFWLYIVPLSGVIIYTIIRHYVRGFGDAPAHWVMQPFFKDHTSYGATLALYFPIFVAFLYQKSNVYNKILYLLLFIINILGIIFSYTRASWLSIIFAFGVILLIYFKIRWWVVLTYIISFVFTFLIFQNTIIQKLEKNRQDSSSNFTEHIKSISNIATDASNLERLNRWDAALKMFFESPITGKGPGTYSFLYAPYQSSQKITLISTNFGDAGNAHSEYLGLLCEQGFLGLLIFLVLLFFIYFRAIKLCYVLKNKNQVKIIYAVIFGLTTYLFHSTLNNFFDIDKINVSVWGFIAIITTMDLYAEKI